MGEGERGVGAEDAGTGEFPRAAGDRGGLEAGESGDGSNVASVAQDGNGASDCAGIGRQARQARFDRQETARGPRSAIAPASPAVGERPSSASALSVCAAGGIASRRPLAREAERLVPRLLELPLDEFPDACLRERARMDGDARRLRGDPRCERRVDARLIRPLGRHEPDRRAVQAMSQVGEETEGGAIAPLQVIDDQQHRVVTGEVQGHPEEAVQDGEGDVAGRGRVVIRARLEQDARGRRRPRERGFGTDVRHGGLEELTRDAEGEIDLELAAAGRVDAESCLDRPLPDRAEQCALADPSRSLDRDRTAVAALDRVESAPGRLEFGLALNQSLDPTIRDHAGTLQNVRPIGIAKGKGRRGVCPAGPCKPPFSSSGVDRMIRVEQPVRVDVRADLAEAVQRSLAEQRLGINAMLGEVRVAVAVVDNRQRLAGRCERVAQGRRHLGHREHPDRERHELAAQGAERTAVLRAPPERAAEVAELEREQRRPGARADGLDERLQGGGVESGEHLMVADPGNRSRGIHVEGQQLRRRDRRERVHRPGPSSRSGATSSAA